MAKLKPFTMPKWGIEMSEGTIAEWMVSEDTPFAKGTLLTLIETDKITNEVEAEADGRFVRIIAKEGETFPVGALLAVLSDGEAATSEEIEALIGSFRPADTSFTGEPVETTTIDAPPAPPPSGPAVSIPTISRSARPRASGC
jgi:pyruvate dehydrogenase E2 component (dihydrolipoamide acetyltransferase)